MVFRPNPSQQISLEDRFQLASKRSKKRVLDSWANGFSEIVFPAINEERFAVLYSEASATCPNTPVNILIGALLIKELFQMTDEEVVGSLDCDLRFQYALHTTSNEEQPLSKNSLNRFRRRLYLHLLETGEDLLQQEMEALAAKFCQFLGIQPTMKRMDTLMVSAKARRLSRVELLHTCIRNLLKALQKEDETLIPEPMTHYLDLADTNQVLYHDKLTKSEEKFDRIIQDAQRLKETLDEGHQALPEFQLLDQVLNEQTTVDEADARHAKAGSEISPDSIQNPADPDATYRRKAGKHHFGYIGNVVETVDEHGAMITDYDFDVNSHADVAFCEEQLEKMGMAETETTLVADGSFNSTENREQAAKQHIHFVSTGLNGRTPAKIKGDFQIEADDTILCPAGHHAYKVSYYENSDEYRGWFEKEMCTACPLFETCQPTMQKKSAVVNLTKNMITRARYLKWLDSDEAKSFADFRNGIEGLPSILRRRYRVDDMPVMGLVRSKIWFALKIGAINVKNLLKGLTKRDKKQELLEKTQKNRFSNIIIRYSRLHPNLMAE